MNGKMIKKLSKKYLKKQYEQNKFSIYKISKNINCNPVTVYINLKKYRIKIRNKKEGCLIYWNSNEGKQRKKKYNINYKKGLCSLCEIDKSGKNNGRYIDGRTKKFSFCIDCKKKNDYRDLRCSKCNGLLRKKTYLKGNNPNWKNGVSFEPYSINFNNQLKEKIRQRDNYQCQSCYIKEYEYYQKLSIHHIDYNKKNCKEENLITLCRECNSKSNHNRKYWKRYFKELIYDRITEYDLDREVSSTDFVRNNIKR